MHHYTRSTYATLADTDSAVPVWRDAFPTEAASHPFLMHGLLSLAAVHMAMDDLTKHKTYVDRAMQHYTLALALYRPELINVTKHNCNALFGFSCIAAIMSFAVSMASQHTGTALLQDIHDTFQLLKGIHAVVEAARPELEVGPLADLLRQFVPRETELPPEVQKTLHVLTERVHTCGESEERKAAYIHSIETLRAVYKNAVFKPDDRTLCLVWPIAVQRPYIDALAERQPMALVILAHYAIFLYDLRRFWWAGDRGPRIVEAVTGLLSPDWFDTLQWPSKTISKEEPCQWGYDDPEHTFKMSPPLQMSPSLHPPYEYMTPQE